MSDPFVTRLDLPSGAGPLAGLRLAVKDLFDLAGTPTGAGNPRWRETHETPAKDAEAVARLRDAGARVVGKTITDELAWSLNGTNAHYGTPDNPAAPGRVPGGSSSGSASAVAAGLADIGLGTDTGGSIRVPASYCGLYGLRPTHGRVSLAGAVPLAPSFDTAGVLTRDAATLRLAMGVLLDRDAGERRTRPTAPITRLLVPQDVWDDIPEATREAVMPEVEALGLAIEYGPLFKTPVDGTEPGTSPLETARVAYATLQAWEAWQAHGAWIEAHAPEFGQGVAARFRAAASIGSTDIAAAQRVRSGVVALVRDRLPDGVALAIPAAPGPAIRIGEQPDREAIVRLTCLAGLAGAPGLAVPAGTVDGLPVGLQLVAAPGADERLLELA
ncbi:amidase [Glycomyces sp. TRM65418]|uniref:amidase n=1 Tax=Glycomyces sp. TRM65418 TaxID=2867006 RepID=UPI001CE4CAF1|nr:amidase [Glycomyces sp. TRM65418]MCC3763684.1 amidase [Glycomyces sp. TRM65418]QZD57663.1 amidase [Glycomyces sp. TRM65418]